MIRSSLGMALRLGRRPLTPLNRHLLQTNKRWFAAASGDDKPTMPPASSEVAPIAEENLPAKLIDFQVSAKIEGEESHVAMVNLGPGETLRAEAGAMLFMEHGITMDTSLSGASSAFSRMMTGMSLLQ